MDYLALPPEINSARIESGPGAAPLLAAAAAWSGIAEVLSSTTGQMASVQGALSGAWLGPSALAEGLASSGYQSWVTQMAGMASSTAAAATAAVTAYETTRAAMVPLVAVVANRTQLAALVATNVLGQNTPAIMATEAAYTEMWAQDVAAMVGYQSETTSATAQLTPPMPPPAVTTGALPAAAVSSAATSTVLPAATSLPSSALSWLTTSNPLLTALADPTTPLGFLETQWLAFSSSGPYQALSYPLFLGMMAQANGFQSRANDLTEEGNRISTELEEDDRATEKPTPPVFEQPPPAHVGRDGNVGKVGALTVPPNWDKSTQQVALASKATPLETTSRTTLGTTPGGGMIPTPIAAVNGPQSKQRNGNEILVKVRFLPSKGV
jgi:PPE-repeat protein